MLNQMRKRPARFGSASGALGVACIIALSLTVSGKVGGSNGSPLTAEANCGSLDARPQVISRYGRIFAAQYDKKLRVSVKRGGPPVRDWQVQLYTFSGFLVGKSQVEKKMNDTGQTTLKLGVGVQPGRYTLVTKGQVRGCGELESDDIVSFRSCIKKLPISFVEKPGGSASDYGGYVSVKIAPKTGLSPITDIYGTLSSFDGDIFGKAQLPRGRRKLIGEQFLDFELKSSGLKPGRYSVYVTGKARQPRSCGDLAKSTKLRFR